MAGQNIRAIIFDLGRVMVDFDYRIAAKKISSFTAKGPEEIFDLFFDSNLTGAFEEGKICAQDFFLRVKEMLDLKLDYAGFLPIWNEIFFLSPANKEVYALAAKLKARYRLALLSNVNILHFDYLQKEFPVFGVFDDIFASFQMGLRKPDPRIYENTLKSLGIPAPCAFYTDDRPELVESALRLGIRGFVFEGVEKLKKDLSENNIRFN